MARIFRMIPHCVPVPCECTHMLGCILETVLNCSYICKLSYGASAHQLPRRLVESPSLEVFKNRTKYPSVQNNFDADLLIRRNWLDFSVKVRFISNALKWINLLFGGRGRVEK